MRALGIVFGGPPATVSGREHRVRAWLACWAATGPLDLVLATTSREATHDLMASWDAPVPGRVVELEPPARDPHRRWRRWRPQHEGPRQAGRLPGILGPFDPTVPRHQVAKVLHDQRYDVVWCADPVAMAFFGKVRRDLPVVVDVPAPVDPTLRPRPGAGVADPDSWHRFEQHVAAGAHLVTVPGAAARELLGVPGAMVLDPAVPADADAFRAAVEDMCRWSEDFHGTQA